MSDKAVAEAFNNFLNTVIDRKQDAHRAYHEADIWDFNSRSQYSAVLNAMSDLQAWIYITAREQDIDL